MRYVRGAKRNPSRTRRWLGYEPRWGELPGLSRVTSWKVQGASSYVNSILMLQFHYDLGDFLVSGVGKASVFPHFLKTALF